MRSNPVTTARTGSGTTYNVGPGQTYVEPDTVPWGSLQAGDVVNIFHRSTPYRWKVGLRGQGTQAAPIVINGVTDANGQRPVFDFNGARTASGCNPGGTSNVFSTTPEYGESLGGFVIKRGPSDHYSLYDPQWIEIRNLELRGAAKGNSYTTLAGATANFGDSAGMYILIGADILLENLIIHDNANGLFTMAKNGAFSEACKRITMRACQIYGNGVVGQHYQHNCYMQSHLPVVEGNYIGRVRAGSGGSSYKSRSSGEIFRYNWVEASNRAVDWVHSEEQQFDGIQTKPEYGTDYAYGNVIVSDANGPTYAMAPIHYGGDNLGEQEHDQPVLDRGSLYRRQLYFWNNTVLLRANQSQLWRQIVFDLALVATTVDAWNNIIAVDSGTSAQPETHWVEFAGNLRLQGTNLTYGNIQDARFDANPAHYRVEKLGTLIAATSSPFINLAADDLRLSSTAPAVNAGGAVLPANLQAVSAAFPVQMQPHLAAVGYDLRTPLGAAIDLGAFESSVGSPPMVAPSGAVISITVQ